MVQSRVRIRISRGRTRHRLDRRSTRPPGRGHRMEYRGDRPRVGTHGSGILRPERAPTGVATAAPRIGWLSLLGHRQTWAFVVGKFMADPIWWFYLYWLPKFLDAKYSVHLAQIALPIIAVYLVADVGSIGGGWM